jgi:hypothetical protein
MNNFSLYLKTTVSAERADERRSIGLDGVLIEDAEQADRAAQTDAQLIRALAMKRKVKTIHYNTPSHRKEGVCRRNAFVITK